MKSQTQSPAFKSVDDFRHRGGGWGWFVFFAVVALAGASGWGFFYLRSIVDRGSLEGLGYVYRNSRLLPGRTTSVAGRESHLRIYLTSDGQTLTPRIIPMGRAVEGHEKIRLILRELFDAPTDGPLRSPLPADAEQRGFFQVDRTAYLDLNPEFLTSDSRDPMKQRLAIYALVNSIVLADDTIDSVQLMVGGEALELAWGWLDCSSPLGANLSVMK